ncbi:hypothetical protein FJY94_03410 [Candidatus Kaiserbacteria bacterium]|nr:hypothetical protein [Candidatus Kaiserbacteria bacterium]
MSIVGTPKAQLLQLHIQDPQRLLTWQELAYVAYEFDAIWQYDEDAAREGRPGLHAELKSGKHSGVFFNMKALLEIPELRLLFAKQVALRIRLEHLAQMPTLIAGVPTAATELGKSVAAILGVPHLELAKEDGRIVVAQAIPDRASVMLIEDVCTRATGSTEAGHAIMAANPSARLFDRMAVVLNRGGLGKIDVGTAHLTIDAVVDHPIEDYDPARYCRYCEDFSSKAIKPKVTPGNWANIKTSQLPVCQAV